MNALRRSCGVCVAVPRPGWRPVPDRDEPDLRDPCGGDSIDADLLLGIDVRQAAHQLAPYDEPRAEELFDRGDSCAGQLDEHGPEIARVRRSRLAVLSL